jgi:lipopolysaccharide transport system ATP-binding protein
MPTAIEFNNISKQYRLGLVSTKTLSHDLNRWWKTTVLHKEDPYLKIGSVNDRSKAADSEYVWALKDIDFKVEQGDVVGIIGKNGAGKSTLLKLLSRVTGPTTGTIKARGRIGSLLEVGTGFHPELTGKENIYMNGAILGMTKQEITRKLDEIVDFSGCERYIDTPVKRYSSGMKVRLGFAVAAHLDPEILVVDEVLAVGDAEFQKKAIGKMQDVSKGEGRTVLFVSHNMASIRHLCYRGVVLENGRIAFMGEVNDAVDKYMLSNSVVLDQKTISDYSRSRNCNGEIKFFSIDFLNNKNEPITPHSGEFVRVHLGIEVLQDTIHGKLSIDLFSQFDSLLMNMPSFIVNGDMALKKGKYYVDCDIDRLPLTGGSYKLSLWASNENGCADFLEMNIPMEVLDDDYFKTGRFINASHIRGKIVLNDYRWTIC